jgi:CDP-paratose 2-epimerase
VTLPHPHSRGRAGKRGTGEKDSKVRAGECVVVTGGAGFVGVNLADRLLTDGEKVRIFDNLSRPGVEHNLRWLRERHAGAVTHIDGDVRVGAEVEAAIEGSWFVFHLAAQVAVTTSLRQPLEDHDINVTGTLNVLEAIRRSGTRPGLMFASTNKVYGALPDIGMRLTPKRCIPEDDEVRKYGISEQRPLEFISPYGCSKGAADQYVLDYCRSFGLAATVLRMSCIYGPHQQANSDQGWVAHFLRTAMGGSRLTIFGDGRQVRDVLYIDDFVDALLAARRNLMHLSGRAFNVCGGIGNTLSLLEMTEIAERLNRHPMDLHFSEPRPGDQLFFAADHRRFTRATHWRPHTSPEEGINKVWSWLVDVEARADESALRRGESLA